MDQYFTKPFSQPEAVCTPTPKTVFFKIHAFIYVTNDRILNLNWQQGYIHMSFSRIHFGHFLATFWQFSSLLNRLPERLDAGQLVQECVAVDHRDERVEAGNVAEGDAAVFVLEGEGLRHGQGLADARALYGDSLYPCKQLVFQPPKWSL